MVPICLSLELGESMIVALSAKIVLLQQLFAKRTTGSWDSLTPFPTSLFACCKFQFHHRALRHALIAPSSGWASDPLNHLFGRKWTIFIGAIFSLCAPFGMAGSQHWGQLAACRVLLGIGMGLKEVTVPVYSAEIAPPNVRGGLVMSWFVLRVSIQVSHTYLLQANLDGVWHLPRNLRQLGGQRYRRTLLASTTWQRFHSGCSSRHWYLLLSRIAKMADAEETIRQGFPVRHEAINCEWSELTYCRSFLRLRKHPIQAARDLYYAHALLRQEEILVQESGLSTNSNFFTRFGELFTIPRVRRATQASGIVMIAQQMCGSECYFPLLEIHTNGISQYYCVL
jgi:hypothetical protein